MMTYGLFSRFGCLAVGAVLVLSVGRGAPVERQVLHGHVLNRVHALVASGQLDPATNLQLAIGLPVRDAAGLANFLREVQDPASSNYRKFVTPEQFADRFGATEQDYEAVVNFATSHGLQVTARHKNRLVLSVRGSARTIENAFHVTLRTYAHPTEARTFHAPDAEPSVDLTVPLLHVSGLDDFARPRPQSRVQPQIKSQAIAPLGGSGMYGSYMGNDFRAAYVPGTSLTGTGQSVGLLQFDGYYASDIAGYIVDAHITTSAILVNVPVNGGVATPGGNNGEVCLDIEMVLAMAPGVSNIYVYEAANPSPWVDLLSQMANDNLAKQLSCSWGGGPPDDTAEQIFLQMAAQGQSFFNASGDSDAFVRAVEFPADSTNIVQVGGTTLAMSGAGSAYASESAWNWGGGQGGSGGISTYYAIPDYQQGLAMAANQGSLTMRNIPDVALTADNIYVRYNNGASGRFGGTSCAAPLWAGFTALVNQQAALNAAPPVGFLNPSFYSIGKGPNYTANFHDTTMGNNFWSQSPTNFSAVPGYDLCTGWGTPNGTNLIHTLVSFSALRITPRAEVSFSGVWGCGFTPSSSSLVLSNAGIAAITWSAGNTSTWFRLSATSGTLPAGGTTNIMISLTAEATNLPVQTYVGTVWLVNQTDGAEQIRTVLLGVQSALQITPLTGTTFSGLPGGPFTPASSSLLLSNASGNTLAWRVTSSFAWLALAPTNGTLLAGHTTNVTVGVTGLAANLEPQSYGDTAWFTNDFDGAMQGRTFALLIQVIQNGGFETGDLTGWTSTGNTTYNDVLDLINYPSYVHSGSYGMALGAIGSLGYVSQLLNTISNRPYLISFWLANPTVGTPNEFVVQWDGRTLFDQVDMGVFAWTQMQFVLLATDSTTRLTFGAYNDYGAFGFDEISAQLLALPAFDSIVAHTNKHQLSWRASANVHYQAQYTTNLVPVSWVNLGGLILGTGGTMTVTDPSPVSSQRFYRVILQP